MSLILLNSEFEVEKSQTYSWNILADVEKALSYSWHIHEYVEKALSYSWTFTVWVEKALSYSWEIRKWIERSLLYSWIITLIVGAVRYEFLSPKRQKTFYTTITNKVFRLKADIVCCIADPAMAYDYGSSGETVAQSNSVTVAITGDNTPFTWAVSGTGFTLDNPTTTGLTNTLNADGTACGSATITITGCDGIVATGYVRCTTGIWIACATPTIDYGEVDYIADCGYNQRPSCIGGKFKFNHNNQYGKMITGCAVGGMSCYLPATCDGTITSVADIMAKPYCAIGWHGDLCNSFHPWSDRHVYFYYWGC